VNLKVGKGVLEGGVRSDVNVTFIQIANSGSSKKRGVHVTGMGYDLVVWKENSKNSAERKMQSWGGGNAWTASSRDRNGSVFDQKMA